MLQGVINIIEGLYAFFWGDLIAVPLPGGGTLGLSLLVLLLVPAGIFCTVRTRFLPVRLFPDMVRALLGRGGRGGSLSTLQSLIVSTATRVGMGTLVGGGAAVSAGGAVRPVGPHLLVRHQPGSQQLRGLRF